MITVRELWQWLINLPEEKQDQPVSLMHEHEINGAKIQLQSELKDRATASNQVILIGQELYREE